ncbi:uncharacterized protein WM277_002728 [Molossus nigricans]
MSDVFSRLREDRLRAPQRRKDRSCQMGSSTPSPLRRHRCPSHLQRCSTATSGDPAVRVFPDVGTAVMSDVFSRLREDRLRAPQRRKDRSCQMGSSTPSPLRRHRCTA